MGLDSALWVVLATAVIGGFASGFINPMLGAVIFERIPAAARGPGDLAVERAVLRADAAGWRCSAGLLVAGFGLSAAMLRAGAAYFLVTMLPAVDPRWRDMDRRPAAVETEPGQGVMPARIARIAACTRSRLPVLASTLVTWDFTVLIDRCSRSEISVLLSPAPTRASTSRSRAVSR